MSSTSWAYHLLLHLNSQGTLRPIDRNHLLAFSSVFTFLLSSQIIRISAGRGSSGFPSSLFQVLPPLLFHPFGFSNSALECSNLSSTCLETWWVTASGYCPMTPHPISHLPAPPRHLGHYELYHLGRDTRHSSPISYQILKNLLLNLSCWILPLHFHCHQPHLRFITS